MPLIGAGERPRMRGPEALGTRPACARFGQGGGGLGAPTPWRFPKRTFRRGHRGPGLMQSPRLGSSASRAAQPQAVSMALRELAFPSSSQAKVRDIWPNFSCYLLECPRIDKGKHIHTSTILPFRKHSYSNPSILGFS